MTAPVLSITETQMFTALGNYLTTLTDAPIVRGMGNRVPLPNVPDYVVITAVGRLQLGQPVVKYDGIAQTASVAQPLQWTVGVDCFGPLAMGIACSLSMVLRTPQACAAFTDPIAPLYAGDATQFPLIDGADQYEERWRFDAVIQYTPILTLAQQSALALEIDLINVDRVYPPE